MKNSTCSMTDISNNWSKGVLLRFYATALLYFFTL